MQGKTSTDQTLRCDTCGSYEERTNCFRPGDACCLIDGRGNDCCTGRLVAVDKPRWMKLSNPVTGAVRVPVRVGGAL